MKSLIYPTILISLLLIAYASNLQWLWSRWMANPNYSHGPFIPLISLFIIFQNRESLKDTEISGSNQGIHILLGGVLLFIISLRAQVNFLMSYSMILVIVGILLFIYGKKFFLNLAFPVFYLFFMIPFWGAAISKLSNLLKIVSSTISYHIFKFFGYSILREGVILHLPNGSLEVADPCSGIRSLMSLLALGALIAYYSDGNKFKKCALLFLAIPIALVWNSFRVIFIGIILESKGILITQGYLHTLTGLFVFIFAFLSLIAFDKWVRFS